MHRLGAVLCLLLLCGQRPARADDPEIERGIRQVEEGNFQPALVILEEAARRLESEAGDGAQRARAWLYVGIAQIGLGEIPRAEDAFRSALDADRSLTLNPAVYARQVVEVFERVSTRQPQGIGAGGNRRSRHWPWWVGGAAVGAGVAAATSGGERASPAPIQDPRTVDDDHDGFTEVQGDCNDARPEVRPDGIVSVSPVTSPEAGRTIRCTDPVTGRIALTNNSCSIVTVTGVHHTSRGLAGGCNPAAPFTYRPIVGSVLPGQVVAVFDRALYSSGSGCCIGGCDGGTCRFGESFDVLTSAGELDAGSFSYSVIFQNCVACSRGIGGWSACPAR